MLVTMDRRGGGEDAGGGGGMSGAASQPKVHLGALLGGRRARPLFPRLTVSPPRVVELN